MDSPLYRKAYVTTAGISSEHDKLALQTIAAHKHVLIEKPMATSAAVARGIADAAAAADMFVMETVWTRYLIKSPKSALEFCT